MTMFVPIYYPYLALIDSCMRMHFLNRVGWLVFGDNFWILGWLVFWDGGSKREKDVLLHHILWSRETHVTICWISKSLFIVYWIFYIPMKHLKIQKKTERQEKAQPYSLRPKILVILGFKIYPKKQVTLLYLESACACKN